MTVKVEMKPQNHKFNLSDMTEVAGSSEHPELLTIILDYDQLKKNNHNFNL